MKTSLILPLLCISASSYAQRTNQEPYMVKSLSAANIKESVVNTSGGSITVKGTTAGDARVEVYVNGNNGAALTKDEAAKRIAENYSLSVEAHDGELHADAKSKRNFSWNNSNSVSISFKVYVPVNSATNLNTSGGSIWLDNLSGKQQGETSGGSISMANSKNNIELETSGGSINADHCRGTIKLQTSGGSLTLNDLSGTIKAESSGGSVRGNDISGELITGTSGGSINLDNLSASVSAYTSAGSIHATFKEVGKYVKLNASAGHINLTLPYKQGLDLNLTGDRITSYNVPKFLVNKIKTLCKAKPMAAVPLFTLMQAAAE